MTACEIARAWSDPKGSRGEGTVLLSGGHFVVAKEKKPAATPFDRKINRRNHLSWSSKTRPRPSAQTARSMLAVVPGVSNFIQTRVGHSVRSFREGAR
jgi:hypothetical protein